SHLAPGPARSVFGGVPEWPKGTDCKSVGDAFGGSNPPPSTIFKAIRRKHLSGNSSVARASAFQAEGRGFESRFPLHPSQGYPLPTLALLGGWPHERPGGGEPMVAGAPPPRPRVPAGAGSSRLRVQP